MEKALTTVVVGIYGVSGSGKSRALAALAQARPEWRCLEGRHVLEEVLAEQKEMMQDFHGKDENAKNDIRNLAVKRIKGYNGVTVVSGHCSFPVVAPDDQRKPSTSDTDAEADVSFNDVFTQGDATTYSFIFYLDKPAKTILQQRTTDSQTCERTRPELSQSVLERWVKHEKELLEYECDKSGVQLHFVSDDERLEHQIEQYILTPLMAEVQETSEANLRKAVHALLPADVFLLIDGDRTLCPQDTGAIFFDGLLGMKNDAVLKKIFQRYPDYTFQAFWEIAMLYGNILTESEYVSRSHSIGTTAVRLYPAWVSFLTSIMSAESAQNNNLPLEEESLASTVRVRAVVVTSGNRDVWEAALESTFGANHSLDLIAGNHFGLHAYVVDPNAKAFVVRELRSQHPGCKILSFGDSAIDIPMLRASDRGYVVLDDRDNRSMRNFLVEQRSQNSLTSTSLSSRCFYQLDLSPLSKTENEKGNSFRGHDGLMVGSLPLLVDELQSGRIFHVVSHTSSMAAALLATQSRRSDLNGPALQAVHVSIGRFLTERLLDSECNVGGGTFSFLEQSTFSHVIQGKTFDGVVTAGRRVLIVPLMRGGEPMARGVYELFPGAQMFHYTEDSNHQLSDKDNMAFTKILATASVVVIVDSVVNEGRSVRRAIRHVLKEAEQAGSQKRLIVLTGVMQEQASLVLPVGFPRVGFWALRVSKNKYKGQGGTDTGNRLFGTST